MLVSFFSVGHNIQISTRSKFCTNKKNKTMIKVLLSTLAALAVFTVIYLVFAFGAWDINPKYWYPEVRALCAVLSIAFGFCAFFTTYETLDKIEKQ